MKRQHGDAEDLSGRCTGLLGLVISLIWGRDALRVGHRRQDETEDGNRLFEKVERLCH